MSLILEALQRADQERRGGGDVPGIDANHASGEPKPARPASSEAISSRIYVPLLLGLVVALCIYVAYLQRPGFAPPATETTPHASNSVPDSVPDSVPGSLPGSLPGSSPGSLPGLAPESRSSQLERELKPELKPQLDPEQLAHTPLPLPATGDERPSSSTDLNPSSNDRLSPAEIAALYERADKQQADLIDYAQLDANQAQEDTQKSVKQTTATASTPDSAETANVYNNEADAVYLRLPFASQLAEHQQRSIPAIRYTTHGYDEQTGTGRVTLNGRAYRRGDSIMGGLLLVDIRSDYIVLDMDGTLFRLHAASDWTP